ncbi:Separin [Diplogelasinospora grovesii]|uniref:separase n=1 Tax=Diplogelasinospora grovesii TaxID=303347 RepID=A0AAN6S6M0_9PEZI|nr:Separin [Diplogelasinospora grovesii]
MTSLLPQADAVRSAVSSVTTCSSTTVVLLKDLLLPKEDQTQTRADDTRAVSRAKATRPKANTTKPTSKSTAADNNGLSAKEKAALATQALGDAARPSAPPPPPSPPKRLCQEGELVKAATRNALRRSSSAPMTPLQPRSLNRQSPSNLLATVESLRLLQGSGKTGMSALHAIKELRILKRRKPTKTPTSEPKTATQAFTDILDFGEITTQAIRILSATKRPSYIEAALPYLGQENSSSPINLFLRWAQESGADLAKIARQMETTAQCLLSLAPSISNREDALGAESRLNISPKSALELQALGLEARLHWWRLAKHQGDVDKELMLPFSRYLGAYIRRSQDNNGRPAYATCVKAFERIHQQLRAQKLQASGGSKYPLAVVYQTLASLARESGTLSDAVKWAIKLRACVDPKVESVAKNCSAAAQLLSLQLREPAQYLQDDGLLGEVLAGIQGPLRGDTGELDELLANVCLVRKSAMNLLVGQTTCRKWEGFAAVKEQLETLILQCPRFCLRWLGKPPGPKSATKDYLRYEQRRQLLHQSLRQTLDSAFMTIKTRIDQDRLAWDLMDSILHDCATLLEYMGDLANPDASTSYHVKISHFYYLQYNTLRQQSTDARDAAPLRALRRSVEYVKHRSGQEKEKAQLTLKLERMAELCRSLGRVDEALSALQAIRNSLVEDGVLESVGRALATEPPATAWTCHSKADSLSRTLSSISKMEQIWIDWTVDLSEAEQAAALEHRLHFVLLGGGSVKKPTEAITLEHPTVDALLRIYIPTRFPIRRLRVLLRLLCSTVGNADKPAEIRTIARDAMQVDERHGDFGQDSSLARFLPHMRAFYISVTELLDACSNLDRLQQSLSAWRTILSACQTRTELESSIDDIPILLDHLQSVADFLRMKGQDNMLATVLQLATDITSVAEGPKPEDLIHHSSSLALQYVRLGQSSKAEQVFSRAQEYLMVRRETLPGDAVAGFHLSFSEYLLANGNYSKADEHLSQARVAFASDASSLQKLTRTRKKHLLTYTSYLHSLVALEKGDSHHALIYSRESVKALFQDWIKLESQLAAKSPADESTTEDASMDMTTTMTTTEYRGDGWALNAGPEFWRLCNCLCRNTLRLSCIYAHLGMFQETMYYAEQAQKIAQTANSQAYLAQCAAWMGYVSAKAADKEKSFGLVEEALGLLPADDHSFSSALLACQMSSVYQDLKVPERASFLMAKAEAVIDNFKQPSDATTLEDKMASLKIEEEKPKPTRGRRAAVKAPAKKAPARGARTTKSTKAAPAVVPKQQVAIVEDAHISKLRVSIVVQKAVSMLSKREWAAALAVLGEVKGVSNTSAEQQIAMAASLLGMSMDQMAHDPVFGVIQDSTISFPAIAAASHVADRSSLKSSPPKKKGGAGVATKEPAVQVYVENLREAQEYLLEAYAVATQTADPSVVRKISAMLQSVGLFLSATSAKAARPTTTTAFGNSGHFHTLYSVELTRNLTWRRERKALMMEKSLPKIDGNEWPAVLTTPESSRRSSLGFSLDLNKFQRDYVDIIPQSWNVVSISLSETKHDLCITRLQPGHSPFILRLPLERASSRDADNEVFNFQQGKSELLEIIKLANETCHDARDMTVKGNKSAWWADREALDARLKDLLENIESIWLGGFRGIFSQQHVRRADLLARFHKSFLNVLDKHLPSRQQNNRRGKKTKRGAEGGGGGGCITAQQKVVVLDPRVLELFIGLGDATVEGIDFDEELTDLLYFVVDILQFHGERNAYDEIDFDSMVVETFDALQSYHHEVKTERGGEEKGHTILVLDKALHVFPWESLPCLQGSAVSRVPSLACLRRLITERKTEEGGEGHYVDGAKGTYILNPSADLKTTQQTFQQPLAVNLGKGWKGIVGRVPTEQEFENSLKESEVLLYFGHGSGAQYIRGRTIRRLEPGCKATVLLMGCSSAKLNEAGEGFEVYGPVWNYLMAGAPAVVGTLWDVTDRDIDRFAGRTFEEWGLMPRGTFQEGGMNRYKGRKGGQGEEEKQIKKKKIFLREKRKTWGD